MNLDDLPTPIIEKNPRRLEKAYLSAFIFAVAANCVLVPHYKLYSEDINDQCAELLEAEESNAAVRSWDRSKRVFRIWRDEGFSASRATDGTITAEVEFCQNVSYLTEASIWYGTKIVDPVLNGEPISFGTNRSAWEIGAEAASDSVQERYDGFKDWLSKSWDNLTEDDSEQDVPEPVITGRPSPDITDLETEPPPPFNEYGDEIDASQPGWTDKARNVWNDWSPF